MEQSLQVQVAFIIPAYNIAGYITECVESIMRQTHITKQIIIVNDGSTDETKDISEKIANKYTVVKVINKQNEGVSIARNVGIKEANAEYICFIDGDDYYLEDFASKFYELCVNNNLDIIRGRYRRIGDCKDDKIYPSAMIASEKPIRGKDFLHQSLKKHSSEVVPWLGFIKTDFVRRNNLRFPEGITYTEDQLFYLQSLLIEECQIMDLACCFYGYRVRENSATTLKYSKNKVDDIFKIVKSEIALANDNPKCRRDIFKFASTTFCQVFSYYKLGLSEERKYIVDKSKQIPLLYLIKHAYDYNKFVKMFLLRFFPKVLDKIY